MSEVEFGRTELLTRQDEAELLTTVAEALAGSEGTVHVRFGGRCRSHPAGGKR